MPFPVAWVILRINTICRFASVRVEWFKFQRDFLDPFPPSSGVYAPHVAEFL